jgi:hypothetical protein
MWSILQSDMFIVSYFWTEHSVASSPYCFSNVSVEFSRKIPKSLISQLRVDRRKFYTLTFNALLNYFEFNHSERLSLVHRIIFLYTKRGINCHFYHCGGYSINSTMHRYLWTPSKQTQPKFRAFDVFIVWIAKISPVIWKEFSQRDAKHCIMQAGCSLNQTISACNFSPQACVFSSEIDLFV